MQAHGGATTGQASSENLEREPIRRRQKIGGSFIPAWRVCRPVHGQSDAAPDRSRDIRTSSCPTTTPVNPAPILMDTPQQRTLRRPDRTHLTPTLPLLSPDTAPHGPIIPMCPHSIGRRRRRQPSPEAWRPLAPPRVVPTGRPASRPRTPLRAMQTP